MKRFAYRARSVLALALLLPVVAASGQTATRNRGDLGREIERILREADMPNALWGVAVYDLSGEGEVFERNERLNYVPASNTKLYTTAVALDLLGPDFRYETDLYAAGPVEDGVLRGPLVIRGSGDPVVGPRFSGDATLVFRQWADSLRARGIRVIEGDVIGDDDVFDDQALGYGWSWDDEPFWYSAEISGLSYHDNTVDFTVRGAAAGGPADVSWTPVSTSYMQVHNATLTTDGGRIRESYVRGRSDNHLTIATRVPEGGVEFESISVSNPTVYFAHVLREVLLQSGIAVSGRARDVDELSIRPSYGDADMHRIARHTSEPLAAIVQVINKRSQNLYAEQVLKTVGAHGPFSDEGRGASAADGWAAARPVLARAGIDTTSIQLVDGSGLSRQNLVSPASTLALLRFMWSHPDPSARDAFLLSLPIGGVDGSLSSRFRTGPGRGNVRAKTGTVSNASTLSGYITSAGGSTLAFSIMANHYTVPTAAVRDVQDRIVEALALYRR